MSLSASTSSEKAKSSVMSLNCSENDLTAISNEVSGYIGILTDYETTQLAKLWSLLLDVFSSPQAYLQHPFLVDPIKKMGIKEAKTAPKDVTIKDMETEFWLACHGLSPDAFLLRFLRARKFDLHPGLLMLLNTLHWRITYDVQSVIEKGETQLDASQFEGKTFLYHYDRWQRPVLYINVKSHVRGTHSQDQLELFTVYMIETTRLFLLDPHEKVTIVFNMDGFGMQNMDYPVLKFLIAVLQNYYPESLGLCLIVNAPWLFQGVWKIIKGYLDPVVQAKIVFAKSAQLDTWLVPDRIPKCLNPAGTYVFHYLAPPPPPSSSSSSLADRASLLQTYLSACARFAALTTTWVAHWLSEHAGGGLGAADVVDLRTACVSAAMRPAFVDYDRCFRMPSYWHRMGVVKVGGVAEWSRLET